MKKIAANIFILFLIISCGPTKIVPVKDSIIVRYVDSVKFHDSTVFVPVPIERYVDIVPAYDTLHLNTSLAEATAFVDTTDHLLKGFIENKEDSIPYKIKWKEKVMYRDSIEYKDKLVEVEVEKKVYPKWIWWVLAYVLGTLGIAGFKLYKKIKIL